VHDILISALLFLLCGDASQTDTRRAWFRADSNLHNDKLVSCLKLNCHNIRAQLQGAEGSRGHRAKRACPPADSGDVPNDDGASAGTEDMGIAEIAQGVGALEDEDKGKAKTKARAKKPKAATAAALASASKHARASMRVQTPYETESDGGDSSKAGGVSDGASAPRPAPEPAPAAPDAGQRRRQPPPQQHSDAKPRTLSASKAATSPLSSPNARGRKIPSVSKMGSIEIIMGSQSQSRSRTGAPVRGIGAETGDKKTMTDQEGKVRKRRNVAATATA